jgi:hypothetical protein
MMPMFPHQRQLVRALRTLIPPNCGDGKKIEIVSVYDQRPDDWNRPDYLNYEHLKQSK